MLKTRLTLWNSVILALILALVGVAIYFTTERTLLAQIDADLSHRAQLMRETWHGPPGGPGGPGGGFGPGPGPGPGPGQERAGQGFGFGGGPGQSFRPNDPGMPPPGFDDNARRQGIDPARYRSINVERQLLMPRIMDPQGKPFGPMQDAAWDADGLHNALQDRADVFGQATVDNIPIRTLTIPLVEDHRVTAVAQFANPLLGERNAMSSLGATLAIVLPLAVVAMLFVGVMLTQRGLKPVTGIVAAAERIGANNLESRLPVEGQDEFSYLSRTFNSMLNRLQEAFLAREQAAARQRQFVSDASHELKTPLTAIRVRTGAALQHDLTPEAYKEHLAAVDRAAVMMSSLVADLLLLASSDEGRPSQSKIVAVSEIMDDATAAVDLSTHVLTLESDPDLKVQGDPIALTRAIVNFLDNASRYTPAGSRITLRAKRIGDQAMIQVEDDGPGIGPEHLAHVFDRFYRADTSRDRVSGGTGLGLAITKQIVEAHRGTVRLESEPGHGVRATILLPAA